MLLSLVQIVLPVTGSRSSGVKRAPTRKKSKIAASASQTSAGSRQAAPPESNLAATTDSQPSASSFSADASGSDAQAPHPGKSPSHISSIVTEVLEFGRIPKEIRNPRTQEERDESLLAQSLRIWTNCHSTPKQDFQQQCFSTR